MATLSNDVKRAIVQQLACYESATDVQRSVKETFGVELTLSQILYYDPTKATPNLGQDWRDLFAATRAQFVTDTASIPIAQKAVRLRHLDRMLGKHAKNPAMTLNILEQAAKEVGGAFTNKRELSGPDGGPIPALTVQFVDPPTRAA